MIGVDKLVDQHWYDGFYWYDGKQKGVDTLKWNAEDALFKGDNDARVYPHVAEPRVPRVHTFEPNILGEQPSGDTDDGPQVRKTGKA